MVLKGFLYLVPRIKPLVLHASKGFYVIPFYREVSGEVNPEGFHTKTISLHQPLQKGLALFPTKKKPELMLMRRATAV